MARRLDKEKAILLRKQGKSYSEIQTHISVNKSTLSSWLHDMPLTKARLYELQQNQRVIEKIRATKSRKRAARLADVRGRVSREIGKLTSRELLIAGLFIYWAEGGKTQKYAISLSNTDPSMIRFFITWTACLGIPKEKLVVRLHLYSDMNVEKEIRYWMRATQLPKRQFRNPYIKPSKFSSVTYKTFGHGTCNIIVTGRDTAEYVLEGIRLLQESF